MKSLKAQHSILADSHEQLEIIEHGRTGDFALVPFQQKLEESDLFPEACTNGNLPGEYW